MIGFEHFFTKRFVKSDKHQRGAILIIALLIVSVIAALAIDFTARFQLSIGRAENRFFGAQMRESLFSLEGAAMWTLKEDKREDNKNRNTDYDHLNEFWAKAEDYRTLIQAEFEDVVLNELRLDDAQGRFNLNQLVSRADPFDESLPFSERYTVYEKRFMRLLQAMPDDFVSFTEAEAITQALMDWVDSNNTVSGSGGAENAYYQSLEVPIRAANNLISSVSELRLIKGMSEEIYEWISPLVVALPETVGININTASVDVLRSLNGSEETAPISLEDAELVEASRPVLESTNTENEASDNVEKVTDGYENTQNFIDSNTVETVYSSDDTLKPVADGLTTGSDYFILSTEVEIDRVKRRSVSLLKRNTNPRTNAIQVQVIKRSTSDIF